MNYRSSVSFFVLAIVFGFCTGNSFANTAVTEPSGAASAPEPVAAGDTEKEEAVAGECCEDGASEYAGAYVGLGGS